jgi:hypothetical protein
MAVLSMSDEELRRLQNGVSLFCCWSPPAAPPPWRSRLDRAAPTAKPHFFRHGCTALRIGGCDHWMIGPQIPAGTILVDTEPVLYPQMPTQDLGAKPAFETHDVIGLHRSPDRHRRLRRFLAARRAAPETRQRLMHLTNQSRELVGRDHVMPHIAADDLGNEIEINFLRRVVTFHVSHKRPLFNLAVAEITAGSASQLRQRRQRRQVTRLNLKG